jgi:hypothetical protein
MAYRARLGYIKNIKDVEDAIKIIILFQVKDIGSFKWVVIYVWDFDANGEGEVSADCVVRYGENADKV